MHWSERGRWHLWLALNGYWLGDFCTRDGCYSADMIVEGDGLRILPRKER
jgi:hypothetical protein